MASGVSTGKISRRKTSREVSAVGLGQVLEAAQDDPFALQAGQHFLGEAAVLLGDHLPDGLADAFQLLARRHPVGAGAAGDAGLHLLLQAADADHEELIQVGAEDRQELEPFQERHLGVLGLLQHPAVEFQPAQFAVDVQRRVVQGRHFNAVSGRFVGGACGWTSRCAAVLQLCSWHRTPPFGGAYFIRTAGSALTLVLEMEEHGGRTPRARRHRLLLREWTKPLPLRQWKFPALTALLPLRQELRRLSDDLSGLLVKAQEICRHLLFDSRRLLEDAGPAGFTIAALVVLNFVIFTETGLLVGFCLPGDSLLVTAGLVCYNSGWSRPSR